MIKKLLCVVLSGAMIFGNAGITMASETEPETVQENVNEETDSPEESFSEEDIFEDGISADDEAAELPDSTEQELEEEPEEENSAQFDVSDRRTLDEVVCWLMEMGFVPSFCTACYREGRTGDRFMALCKNMQILNCCHPNALMTLKEYLEDYAGEETKKIGMELIDRELEKIPNPKVKQTAYEHIHDIAEGKRDFRF